MLLISEKKLKNIKPIPCILIIITLVSCGKNPGHEGYYYVSGTVDSGAELFVNGNPTDRGHAISLFIIQGENTIEQCGDFNSEGYSLRLIKSKDLFGKKYKEVLSVSFDNEEAKQNRVVKFTEPIWWKWVWQNADELNKVTVEDYNEIFLIADNLSSFISKKDFTATSIINLPYVTWWTEDKKLKEKTMKWFQKANSNMSSPSELIFRKADRQDIETVAGKYIVMLRGKGQEIFYLGPKKDKAISNAELQWSFSYSMTSMFFSKFNGQWKLLLPIN